MIVVAYKKYTFLPLFLWFYLNIDYLYLLKAFLYCKPKNQNLIE